jgi:dephospho-CoA kinase
MIVVGLTGGIAAGKSTVAEMFVGAGIPVICADELAHQAVRRGSPALDKIVSAFGPQVIDEAGGLDRVAMAEIVFNDETRRRTLESIIHPVVAAEMRKRTGELRLPGHEIVVVDVPLLYEAGWEGNFDSVIVVHVPAEVQESRLVIRDGVSQAEARSRLDAQIPIDEKKRRADIVIDNSGEEEKTREQVLGVVRSLELRTLSKRGLGE